MAFKRLFDRVVLKLSKLAYAGIYSDSEADEFAQQLEGQDEALPEPEQPKPQKAGFLNPPEEDAPVLCERCGKRFADYWDGHDLIKAAKLAERSRKAYGLRLCVPCIKRAQKNGEF